MQTVARVFGVFFRASKNTEIEPQHIRKIAWIRLDHIGDVVMSLPSLQLLREQFPTARIDIIIRPSCRALFDDLKLQDRVLVYDSPRFPQRDSRGRGRGAGLFRTLRFIHKLRRENYDVAIEPRGDDIARLLCWMSKTPMRIGPNRVFYEEENAPNLRFLMTHVETLPTPKPTPSPALPLYKGKGGKLENLHRKAQCDQSRHVLPSLFKGEGPGMGVSHAVRTNCALLQPLLQDRVLYLPQFQFPIIESRRARIETLLKSRGVSKRFAVLHPCSNDDARNWTTQNWSQITDFLVGKNYDVVLSGIARDRETHREIMRGVQNSSRIHDFAGAIALPDLATFFSVSRLLVTVDTGPMHIAAFCNTPIVALFLPHLAPRHAPFGQEASVVLSPLNLDEPDIEYSIKDISVEDVTDAIARKLENR